MHNGNQNQQHSSKDKLGRSPKENMESIVDIENKRCEMLYKQFKLKNSFIMLLSNMATIQYGR